ncbi:hypothetical protein ACLMJK_008674 [Lecanora helva]
MLPRIAGRHGLLLPLLAHFCNFESIATVATQRCSQGYDCDSSVKQRASLQFEKTKEQVPERLQSPLSFSDPRDHGDLLDTAPQALGSRRSSYNALLNALDVMESHFFEVSHGTWPQAIDWTAAVMGTQVSATLSSMTEHPGTLSPISAPSLEEARDHENLINRYFTQIASFYFGENAFSLRTQAYDDMLWVVLGWLEGIKFIKRHSELHYTSPAPSSSQHKSNHSWYAHQFIPQYAHRARLFYDLASRGWDTSLCGGGMIWNPYLAPYKNAITNELFIAASVSMYLYFPGDDETSPFSTSSEQESEKLPPAKAHDVRYLENAVEAYKWLNGSGMRNEKGLYVDGFHIKGWRGGKDGSNGTRKCDIRDDKVYTYNQGVILSGLKMLWEATGSIQYLQDGHILVRNVIAATGWADRNTDLKWRWAGLGRNGVLEEQCDWSGTCSQNGQTFKGIFFHHLTLFCSPLSGDSDNSQQRVRHDDNVARHLHQKSCDEYGDWIRHNAFAAYVTRNEDGVFGEWWGRPFHRRDDEDDDNKDMGEMERSEDEGTDYRNEGVPMDAVWRLREDDVMYKSDEFVGGEGGRDMWRESRLHAMDNNPSVRDLNDRGRGRTVETQSGGLAVLRALWTLVESREDGSK